MLAKDVARAVFQLPMQLLKAVAEANIEEKFDAEAVFQLAMFWLKAVAEANIEEKSDAAAVFQLAMSDTLKAVAAENIPANEVTLAVFHNPMGKLNAAAPEKAWLKSVTDATFQAQMLSLNVGIFWKSSAIDVTLLKSQFNIGPYDTDANVALLVHATTAACMFPWVIAVNLV